jgi:glycosyltransferase involved in cell wall biosynthesis
MKIAQIAPLAESCPPRLYGGTERVVANLTNELVMLGHDVTLFASGDSQTLAELDAPCERALRLSPRHRDPLAYLTIQLGRVVRRAHEFDALHFHLDYPHFPAVAGFAERVLTTQHGRLDLPDLAAVIREFPSQAMVSISESQRQPLPRANWVATVYHGIPTTMHQMGDGSGGYLAFLGRICPEKGVERAIAIAERTQVPLRLAAKVDRVDAAYFASTIKPLLHDPLVAHVGEIGDREKTRFLGDARALLFPIDWPEPFGLVMIEAMACGTPVIAWRRGSVPEIIQDGVTGFIVDSIDEAIAAVARLGELDRRTIRKVFEARFSSSRMAADYLRLYEAMSLTGVKRSGARDVA